MAVLDGEFLFYFKGKLTRFSTGPKVRHQRKVKVNKVWPKYHENWNSVNKNTAEEIGLKEE